MVMGGKIISKESWVLKPAFPKKLFQKFNMITLQNNRKFVHKKERNLHTTANTKNVILVLKQLQALNVSSFNKKKKIKKKYPHEKKCNREKSRLTQRKWWKTGDCRPERDNRCMNHLFSIETLLTKRKQLTRIDQTMLPFKTAPHIYNFLIELLLFRIMACIYSILQINSYFSAKLWDLVFSHRGGATRCENTHKVFYI